MPYILRYKDKSRNESRFVLTARCTVFCPENATRFDTLRSAKNEALNLLKEKLYDNLEAVLLTEALIMSAFREHADRADIFLYPIQAKYALDRQWRGADSQNNKKWPSLSTNDSEGSVIN